MGGCGSKKDERCYLMQTLHEHEGEDKTARVWSTKTELCECIGILRGHTEYINCILIEDYYVLTGSADKTVRKWDVGTCDCLYVLTGHTSVVYRMICTGDFIFTSSYDRTARCWSFDSGECIRVFRGHKRGVYPLIFMPADENDLEETHNDSAKDLLITGSADFTARTWDFDTGQQLKTFKGHKGAVTCMSVDPHGKILFTGSTDYTIRSWHIYKGNQLKLFEGHQGSVICMQVVNKILYSGSSDHTGRAWVTEFGDNTRIYKGHRHTVSVIKIYDGMAFTACGDALCRVFDAKSARCFDARTGSLLREFKGHDGIVTNFQLVEGRLFTSSYDGCVKVWDVSELGSGHDPNFKLRFAPRVGPLDNNNGQLSKTPSKDMEKIGGLGSFDDNQNQNGHHLQHQDDQHQQPEKIMIE
ncbi:hypothetical protein ACOMHN_049518 [Nucella lapillus]